MTELVLSNATLVLPGETRSGSLRLTGGTIADIDDGTGAVGGAVDCEGDLVVPGLVELHTDNLERHMTPRPGVDWPHDAAILAHDGELASCGITTVFDAVRVGSIVTDDRTGYGAYARRMATEIMAMRAAGALKISHFLHLRAEICSETLLDELDEFGPEDRVGILSLMDHTPGQRQFRDLATLRAYVCGSKGLNEAEFGDHVARLKALQARLGAAHEAGAVAAAGRLGAVLASHDDTTAGQVETSAGHGVALAEFPTTREAAEASRAAGIAVMMGAPNLIRGGSHSGNVAAARLVEAGLLDILSSDYVPGALLTAAMMMGNVTGNVAAGIAAVTDAPARAANLGDRGRLELGLRGDLVRLRMVGGRATIRGVWVQGRQVG